MRPLQHSMIARLKHLINTNHGTHRGLVRLLLAQAEYCVGSIRPFIQPLPAEMQRAIFVCLGNINRSCFAEYVARREGLATASMGLSTTTGKQAFHKALALAPTFGVTLDDHRTTDRTDFESLPGDIFFCMEIRHARRLVAAGIPAEQIRLLGRWARPMRIHIHDPHVLSDAYFETCFAILHSAVLSLARDVQGAAATDPAEPACRST